MQMKRPATPWQRDALKWLREHNGDGVFDKHGVLLAAGELAPFARVTWNRLASDGFVEFYKTTGKATRCRIIVKEKK